ncbi:type IV pilus biogenesis/stability protein PilW [Pseudomonas sp. N040]|uniref:type IV pilus biogenesis/stability protein PilW n=1 Tax=Pseudomonas sp. N040 TaxID=2785325 RepID=UPI0018A312C5|nr:type IV pilus biogenesis/stability protein PilW [Pseudomonas sp. N040]MBF7731145.1 type IV pilus biogenesis/stability protein PilW [Pseudomonas sp. N040]MBW7014788.1 type IV pilus biogenesis/stability protein PilW [Pseudomonas sp. N040]
MTLRVALFLMVVGLLAGCVTTGDTNPMKTPEGREKAVNAYVQLGVGYLQQGDTERAKAPLQKALDIDPSNADANAALAMAFQIEMEPELAEKYYRRALSESDDSTRILNNYGSFLYDQKRYEDAYEYFQKAAADTMYPERSRVFENLGLTALKLNQRDKAKLHFQKALRLDPTQPSSLLELGILTYEDKEYVPARDYYTRYQKVGQQNARSILLGIRLAVIFEERDVAASDALQLKRLYPASPEYQQYLLEKK